jgi:hypothetical protein
VAVNGLASRFDLPTVGDYHPDRGTCYAIWYKREHDLFVSVWWEFDPLKGAWLSPKGEIVPRRCRIKHEPKRDLVEKSSPDLTASTQKLKGEGS